jgi:HEAT repeat protein
VAALGDEDWELRAAAAHALGNLGVAAADSVQNLALVLRDRDWRVAEQVVESLSKIGAPAVPVLVQGLQDQVVAVRWGSARALGSMSSDAVEALPALSKALQDQVMQVQWAAARSIWSIGEETNYKDSAGQTAPGLIGALSDDDWVVRWSAARALGAVGDPSGDGTVSALANALQDPDSRVCEAASFALEQMGMAAREAVPALGTAATTVNDTADPSACKVIDAGGEEAAQVMLGTGWTVRWTAVRALGVVGADTDAALPPLTTALRDEEWQVRGVAALALGQFENDVPEQVVVALVESLKDEHAAVRKAAAIALGEIGPDARTAEPGLRQAMDDEDAAVRDAAEQAILKISDGSKA